MPSCGARCPTGRFMPPRSGRSRRAQKGELRRAPYRGAPADLADRFKTVSRVIGSPKKGGEPLPEASEAPEDDEALPRSHAGGGLASR
jgi:hypothetical protein